MSEIVNISYIGPGLQTQDYSSKDNSLITNSYIYTQFGDPNDYVELFIYDQNNILLDKVYNVTSYLPGNAKNPITGQHNQMVLDPQGDLASRGFDRGNLNIQYNFLRNLFNSSYGQFYWIKEISQTRTELKIASQNVSNTDILNGYNQYQAYAAGLNYYNDFYLNFGNNNHIIAVNVAYTEDDLGAYLLIKLYEPLPSDFDLKDQLWIVEKLAEPVTYNVDIQIEASAVIEQNILRGPNYNVDTKQQTGQSTPYYSYQSISNTSVSSSFQKMMSYYQDKSININVDYSNFANFIHFSSATERVQNFANKAAKIETYTTQINQQLRIVGGISNPAVSSSIVTLQNAIDSIITNFDNYEYFLYYQSSSFAWPKSTLTQPYSLYSVTSSQAINWLGSTDIIPAPGTASVIFSASYYDNTNKDLLSNVVPRYIQDDASNQPYITFVNMVAQNFDNIWIYYKDVTNRFEATNNPHTGVSPDLVADALINLGLTLYTNTNISDNLYYSLFGINADGSLLPPTGSEHISNYVTSSLTTLPADTIQKEIYKRLYHNIPYIYKTKGTRESIKALTNIFGVPSSILTMNEFGGYNRYSVDGVDYINNSKVTGSGVVLELSASVLSPYTTVQYYDNENRLNSRNLEFGFAPSDELNSTITSSLGYFNIDSYIGNPAYQYSSSYSGLDQYRRSFFSGYNYKHNIYEYIRILKYYNNTLFKIVQDFVPARADLSTGLIVKSHILERNKYQRNEPEVDIDSNFSQSIDLVEVSGTDPDEIPFSTANTGYSQFKVIPQYYPTGANYTYGPVAINNKFGWEKYTGEFGGSEIQADFTTFDQVEYSSYTSPWTSSINSSTASMFVGQDQGALYNNVSNAVLSNKTIEAEYSYGIGAPVNLSNIISQSSCESCNRIYCYNYLLESTVNVTQSFSYQDCSNNVNYTILIPSSSMYICAKPSTLLFYLGNTTTTGSYTITGGRVCATAFSNYPYEIGGGHDAAANCVNTDITFTSIFTGSATVDYVGCYGAIGSIHIGGPASYVLGCIQAGSVNVTYSSGSGGHGFYNIIEGDVCITLPPYSQYCYLLENGSIGAGYTSWSITYTGCDGVVGTRSGTKPIAVYEDLAFTDCVRKDSLVLSPGVSFTLNTGSSNVCGYYEDQREYTGSRTLAEVQDYNYYRQSSINSKYNGAKSISAKYNVFTPGDDSYGTSPAIDYYIDYTGLFTSLESSSYFPNQMVAKMSYMADISGGLQDLNLQNNNWVYFQNMYKPGDRVTVKQFNATQYSNQKYLDQQWTVLESGWSYPPYWYRASGSTTECYVIENPSFIQGNASIVWSGGRSLSYIAGMIPDSTGGTYGVNNILPTIPSGSYAGTSSYSNYATSLYSPSQTVNDDNNLLISYSSGSTYSYITGSYYSPPSTGVYNISSTFQFTALVGDLITYPTTGVNTITLQIISGSTTSGMIEGGILDSDQYTIPIGSTYEFITNTLSVNTNNILLKPTDKIYIKLSLRNNMHEVEFSAQSFTQNFEYIPLSGEVCISLNSSENKLFSTSSLSINQNTIQLTSKIDSYFNSGSTFDPSYVDGTTSYSQSILYPQFGDVNYTTEIYPGDFMILYYNGQDIGIQSGSLTPIELYITAVSGSPKNISFVPAMPSYISGSNINNYQKAVFVKRVPDETVAILQGNKRPGDTSYGFLVPENVNPNIQKNINTLQATIQSQILNY